MAGLPSAGAAVGAVAWRSTMSTEIQANSTTSRERPLRPKEVWAIRVRLRMKRRKRDLAMFNLAIDSKLRGCDLVSLRVDDILPATV